MPVLDPRTNGMRPFGTLASGCALAQARRQADGRILVSGGVASRIDAPHAEWIDERSGRTTPAAPRTLARSVMLPSGQVLLFGGQQQAGRHSASAERYDPATGGRTIAPLGGDRAHHSVNRLPDGRVLVVGGESRTGTHATAVLAYH